MVKDFKEMMKDEKRNPASQAASSIYHGVAKLLLYIPLPLDQDATIEMRSDDFVVTISHSK
jgi:hypothetical protein